MPNMITPKEQLLAFYFLARPENLNKTQVADLVKRCINDGGLRKYREKDSDLHRDSVERWRKNKGWQPLINEIRRVEGTENDLYGYTQKEIHAEDDLLKNQFQDLPPAIRTLNEREIEIRRLLINKVLSNINDLSTKDALAFLLNIDQDIKTNIFRAKNRKELLGDIFAELEIFFTENPDMHRVLIEKKTQMLQNWTNEIKQLPE